MLKTTEQAHQMWKLEEEKKKKTNLLIWILAMKCLDLDGRLTIGIDVRNCSWKIKQTNNGHKSDREE